MLLRECLKNRLKFVDVNFDVVDSYLEQASSTLSKINKEIEENDNLWASVKIYYAAYYSISAFLWRLGVTSDNHECSIKLASYLLDETEFEKNISLLKKSRIDNQYYLKISDRKTLDDTLQLAKNIYIKFYNICKTNSTDIEKYKKRLMKIKANI